MTQSKLREKRDERARLVAQGRAILEKAETEKRSMTDEEQKNYDDVFKDVEKAGKDIERWERQLDLEREQAETASRNKDDEDSKEERDKKPTEEELRMSAYRKFLRSGFSSLSPDELRVTQQADELTLGGYVVPPLQWINDLLKTVDDSVLIRTLATKYSVPKAQSLGVPTLDSDVADAEWTSELATGNETNLTFGKRELHPHPLAKRIKASNKLLRAAMISIEDLVRTRLAYKFAVTEEKAFLLGTGVGQPLGLFTASPDGIPTSRDVTTGSATDFTPDALIDAKFTLKGAYLSRARWLFHRTGVGKLAKLKDANNNYMWQASLLANQPDTLLSRPVIMSEFTPNTFTTGLYVGLFGDFSYYWIADALDMQIQRLNELYAEQNTTGWIGRLETDGMPVMAEAFVRLKTA